MLRDRHDAQLSETLQGDNSHHSLQYYAKYGSCFTDSVWYRYFCFVLLCVRACASAFVRAACVCMWSAIDYSLQPEPALLRFMTRKGITDKMCSNSMECSDHIHTVHFTNTFRLQIWPHEWYIQLFIDSEILYVRILDAERPGKPKQITRTTTIEAPREVRERFSVQGVNVKWLQPSPKRY